MVASIRDSGNIFYSKSATITTSKRTSFARVDSMDVDDVHEGSPDNYDNVRGLTILPTKLPLVQISCLLLQVWLTVSRSLMVDFIFYFLFSLYFSFLFLLFYFLFLEQLGLGFICHTVTSVTS